ncbi:MAG: endonuclease [Prevotella sp.]|nr:endonuclease [Prevotella sp.]
MRKIAAIIAMTMALTATWAQGPNNTKTYYEAANGKSGQALKTALSGIIKNGHDPIGYNDNMYEAYKNTDTRPDGKVRDWYSNATNFTHVVDKAGSYKNEGDCYNREHTLPQSWFESYGEASTIKCDIIHVVPTDGKINGMRGNVPLAEVNPSRIAGQSKNGYSKWGMCGVSGYGGTVFEPNDEIKGDIARIYFYVVTRYENTATKWANNATASAVFNGSSAYQPFKQWYFDMLVRWAQNDPVDDLEIARNNAVYEEQGNRNPFVDYPGLEDYIWGEKKNEAFDYTNFDGSTTTVSMPTFSPEGGTYSSAQSVTISCPTNGATIFYTTDGTTPSASSTQ